MQMCLEPLSALFLTENKINSANSLRLFAEAIFINLSISSLILEFMRLPLLSSRSQAAHSLRERALCFLD